MGGSTEVWWRSEQYVGSKELFQRLRVGLGGDVKDPTPLFHLL
jgi:hypothetical protein